MNFICFLSSDAVVSGGVVLVEWFIDFFYDCVQSSMFIKEKLALNFVGECVEREQKR